MLTLRSIQRLAALADDLSTMHDWPDTRLNAPLLIYDLLDALGATPDQLRCIFDGDTIAYILTRRARRHAVTGEGRA